MHFVIAGKVNCPQFVFATMIAQKLKDSLPEFTYSRISKKSGDWEKWLVETCRENEWLHSTSPIIWREIAMIKGKKYLIGNITNFLDLCQDHYGLTKEMISGEQFHKAEMKWFVKRSELNFSETAKMKMREQLTHRCRKVCIFGAASRACDILIMELLHIPLQNRENGLEIWLYDEPRREKKLKAMAEDAKYSLGYSGVRSCRVAENIKDALFKVDLVIVLDSFPRRQNESLVKWLKRNRNAMCILGNALNKYAKVHCRVIIGSPSNEPVCYNATVLASFATKLHVRNIVVVTQDLGRETLRHLSQRVGLKMAELNCPPVWGFVGLNKYVDLRNTLQTQYYKVPGPRASKNLPYATEELEIRTIDPFLQNDDINKIALSVMLHKLESMPQLGRISQLAKITAILDLLRVWGLKQEDGNGEILSLGVYSDGTFNIPEGLFWSQPVTLEKGFWKPFGRYPIPRKVDINLHNFFILGVASLAETKVTVRKQRQPMPYRKKKESKKFDVNSMRDSVKLPVVRTKAECLDILRRLAREEMGLDFSEKKSLTTITECSVESTIEEIPPEKIYCECWRQEILQLRKMATEKSSTTELEVDLSENLSGSEWSVVNPPAPYVPSQGILPGVEEVNGGSDHSRQSSGDVICNCGPECHCLDPQVAGKKSSETKGDSIEQEESTEHFYKRQDARVYVEDDVTEVIYEDMYKKEVRFEPTDDPCAGKSKKKFKFYGMKDVIVDEEKRQQALKRIRRYERGEGDDEGEKEEDETSSVYSGEYLFFRQKFHVSFDENYEIVGDQEGLEALEEMRRNGPKEQADDFTEMWADEVTPALQVLSTDSETSTNSMEVSLASFQTTGSQGKVTPQEEEHDEAVKIELAEDETWLKPNLEVIPEAEMEEEVEEGMKEMVEEVVEEEMKEEEREEAEGKMEGEMQEEFEGEMVGEVEEEVEGEMEEQVENIPVGFTEVTDVEFGPEEIDVKQPVVESVSMTKAKRKYEGIPLCCLCRCIIPEGELGCNCGETKVMEVFKQESMEEEFSLIIESVNPSSESLEEEEEKEEEVEEEVEEEEKVEEDEKVEEEIEKEEKIVKKKKEEREVEEEEEEEEEEKEEEEQEVENEEEPERKKRDIFYLPPETFFPFSPKPINKFVPSETSPGITEDTKNILDEISLECLEMMEEAKSHVAEEIQKEDEEKERKNGNVMSSFCFDSEHRSDFFEVSTQRDFRVKDWTTILRKKYKEWFETFKNVPDDFYYDMAAEEPSDEECELEKELSRYFEC